MKLFLSYQETGVPKAYNSLERPFYRFPICFYASVMMAMMLSSQFA